MLLHRQSNRATTNRIPVAGQRPIDQECYTRVAAVTPTMESVLWQILRCSHQGISKRMYLEGKALELASLVMEQEIEIRDGTILPHSLKPDIVDRVHHAKDILLQRLDNPPSLMELAREVGLNECTLKRGFRQIFSTTAYGYLHNYRLEQAQQLLEAGDMNIAEVARAVGFASRRYFAAAFRKKFGLNPKEYLMKWKYFI